MGKTADNIWIMQIRIGIFCFLTGIFFFSNSNGLYGEEKIHTVGKGETFYSIARGMGVKADDLMKYNGITDPSKLQAGQRLKIPPLPGQAASVPVPANNAAALPSGRNAAANYQVAMGDTLYGIAKKFSVTVAAILEANNLPSGHILRVGDTLKLPSGAKPGQNTGRTETVSAPAASAASNVLWPVSVVELNYMTGKLNGVAITGKKTEPVKSLTYGTVLSSGPYRGFGRVVIVQVEGAYLYVYGGCENLSVKEGDKVSPGTELGNLGVDAVSGKPQLFFMVYKSNVPIDPAKAPRA